MKKIFAKVNTKLMIACLSLLMLAGFGSVALAAPSSTPEEIIDAVAGGTIDEAVDLSLYMIQNYLGYILALSIVVGVYFLFRRYSRPGSR